jgi:hypothetical protein
VYRLNAIPLRCKHVFNQPQTAVIPSEGGAFAAVVEKSPYFAVAVARSSLLCQYRRT